MASHFQQLSNWLRCNVKTLNWIEKNSVSFVVFALNPVTKNKLLTSDCSSTGWNKTAKCTYHLTKPRQKYVLVKKIRMRMRRRPWGVWTGCGLGVDAQAVHLWGTWKYPCSGWIDGEPSPQQHHPLSRFARGILDMWAQLPLFPRPPPSTSPVEEEEKLAGGSPGDEMEHLFPIDGRYE